MKRILLLLLTGLVGLGATAQTTYQPNGTASFSGGGTYCVGSSIGALTYQYTTCSSGTGASYGTPCHVSWYYNATNTTAITSSTTLVSSLDTFTAATAATGTLTYTPMVSSGGEYYYFCVVDWASGTPGCGGVTGSFVSSSTQLVRISPPPIAPATPINMCMGDTRGLSNPFPGGVWTSSNTSVATIDASTGTVTTGSGSATRSGSTTITYTLGGCYVTALLNVHDVPAAISPSGTSVSVCEGATLSLASTTPGGTWSSTVPSVATIGSSTGVVSAFSVGTSRISYIMPATGCFQTKIVNVTPNPAPISGSHNVCIGGVTALTDATPGGNWISGNPTVASVDYVSGIVTGYSTGSATITYVLGTGCYTTFLMNVNLAPGAITGPAGVCAGNTIAMANSVPGGVWSTSDASKATIDATTGILTGVAGGTVYVSYTTAGCLPASRLLTILSAPNPISGVFSTCYGQTTTLGSIDLGGTWTSSDTTIATVNMSTGVVSGINMGAVTITYTNMSGCQVFADVTVHPMAPILGYDTVCVGSETVLTDIVGGGTWESGNPAVASVDTFSGRVTGLSTGITFIGYQLPTGCATTLLMHVIPPLPPIGGPLSICNGVEVVLSNAAAGGRWSTSNDYVADVDSVTGNLEGHFPDTAVVTYKVFGCSVNAIVTVNPLPTPSITYDWSLNQLSTGTIYAAYQWYDSTAGAIPGATNSTFAVPYKNEKYLVEVTDGLGCSKKTDWYKFTVGVNELENGASISVYPNPVSNELFINAPDNLLVSVWGIDGRSIIEGVKVDHIDVSLLLPGMYFVKFETESGGLIATRKFVKK